VTQLISLFKTSALSGIENIVKLLLGLAIIKMIAFSYGPKGMALFGQFQNMYTAVIALAAGMLVTGAVRYSAQYHDDRKKLNLFLNEAMFFSLVVTSILCVTFLIFSDSLSQLVFGHFGFSHVFQVFSACLVFITLNIFSLSMLNGLGLIRPFIYSKISLSLCLMVGSVLTIWLCEITTFFYTYVLLNALGFIFVAHYLDRFFSYDRTIFWKQWKTIWRSRLFSFWLMAIVGAISTPLVLSVMRKIIVDLLGIESAGYWDAITRLTELYLVIITGAMLTYYIPKLGRCQTAKETKYLVYLICGFAVAISVPITIFIYILRYDLVRLVLDESFIVTVDYFGIALVGSVLKIISWVFCYYMIAKSRVKSFIFFELIFSMLLVFQVALMTPEFGLYGVFYASTINAFVFCLCTYGFFLIEMRRLERSDGN